MGKRGAYLFKTWKDEEERGGRGRALKCETHARDASGFRLDWGWYIKGGFRRLTCMNLLDALKE